MSSGHAITNGTIRFAVAGLIILSLAFVYDVFGWDFLSRNFDLTSRPDISKLTNEDGIPANQYFKVTAVDGGNTIHIEFNGVDEQVKLIGINMPQISDKKADTECYGEESYTRLKDLVYHENIRLETDATLGPRDVYGRILAYIYLEDGEMVNRKLIAEGNAYEYTYMNAYKYQKDFRSAQNLAKASLRGLWADNSCNGLLTKPQ